MICPCRNCEFRRPACHGECEVYAEWRKHYEDMRADRIKTMEARAFLTSSFIKADRRRRKK